MNHPKLDFVFYGGCASLDLYNTLRRRKDPKSASQDLLQQDNGFKKWFLEAQKKTSWASSIPSLSERAMSQPVSVEVESQALQVRGIIERLINKRASSHEIKKLNDIAQLRPHWELSLNDGLLAAKNTLDFEALLGYVAEDCIQLFTSNISINIKECAQDRCGIIFLDRSNGAKRNWCSMKTCGNRAKALRSIERKSDS